MLNIDNLSDFSDNRNGLLRTFNNNLIFKNGLILIVNKLCINYFILRRLLIVRKEGSI